ncbi:site-specific integrase [Lentzea flaviverrucosa]|uniref:Site-specific recombinase XerD n=1 Tax=Lentzea flaviverrucosa TaxID=200379 RepID=A0A1H9SNF0_9PSEU|nr:site-specific integrase [Lentzea flaviverrucosa]RDI25447.1 site-specific recombinase XerD [Lentzea flaviverrucosa]SER86447.1 Site-specific recombinase XerD [Lentzea flaviverrucosa]
MTGKKKRRGKPSDGSVFRRGRKWAYAFPGPPHPLTGVRDRITKSGYETEDEAWEGMEEARSALATETYVKPSRATINEFFEAYFPYLRLTVEATTAANYETMARTYVMPIVGKRLVQDFVPSMVAALYEYLLTEGRQKRDTNGEMYALWKAAGVEGREIRPREIADKVGLTYAAARRAVRRYEVGRIPKPYEPGLSAKTVKSVHIMLSSAMTVAVVWKYINLNPIRSVKAPSVPRRNHNTWTPEQMMVFLEYVQHHRWYALWVLEASTGVRRSELCGVELAAFDLQKKLVRMAETTRVIAGGKAVKGTGKSQKSRRSMALDSFTCGVLTVHFQQVERDKEEWGETYQDHGLAFCWEDGRPIYPDTITEEFNRIVDFLGLPKIRFHDVRHTYATIALRTGIHPKIVSSRLGHATVAFTLDTYSADVEDLDRDAAEAVIGLFLPSLARGLI